MATTTNYGWTTPDNTALVKDGASAIRTLGSSVDTTVKALSPGTTAGDIDYYTSSTAKSRIAIGSSGQVLTVSGGIPAWATASSGSRTLLSTTTLTGASVTISSISQSYKDLYIVIKNFLPSVDNRNLSMRFNADATASRHTTITNYSDTGATTFNDSSVAVVSQSDNATSQNLTVITIPEYTNTTTWKIASCYGINTDSTTTTSYKYKVQNYGYNQTSAISSLSFFPNADNLTSGTVLIYGVN
jgi:hypothetical protein